ncbi:hypothetical protein EVG20_g4871 [Dentipellis fragilis]|uniref:NAD(P)-binding protein n=1 Tax=Dentipellis fragilis TaxID=205917 RepID=A0A4Y9YWX4_9AGAM|nr:hypothetical protein EVG20_g4871 [Dentipellis fragilis]
MGQPTVSNLGFCLFLSPAPEVRTNGVSQATCRYRSCLPTFEPPLPIPPTPVNCSLNSTRIVTSMGNYLSHTLSESIFRWDWVDQSFPPKARWAAVDMPDMGGKVVILPAATVESGRRVCQGALQSLTWLTKLQCLIWWVGLQELLKKNAKVYMASRSKERCLKAIEDIKAETGKEALFIKLQLDLSDLASVKQAAEEFLSKEKELDILINNGGLMGDPHDVLTAQGYDMQFGSNTLGTFYFTTLVRVISTSSASHMFVNTIEFDTLKDSKKRRKTEINLQYSQSKLGVTLFSKELARRVGADGIVSFATNPGMIATNIGRNLTYIQGKLLSWLGKSASQGAITHLWAATSPDAGAPNGAYVIPFARLGNASPAAEDPKLASDLWAWMDEQVAAFEQSIDILCFDEVSYRYIDLLKPLANVADRLHSFQRALCTTITMSKEIAL